MASFVDGATALVTGASRGIGLAIARSLGEGGARVIMAARSRERLDAAARAVGGTAVAADVASESGVLQLAELIRARFGGAPDILVNAAGAFGLAPVAETSVAVFDEMLATNLRAPFMLIRRFLPEMLARGSGHVVSIGSIAGRQAFAANGAYSASKFGLRGLHEVLEAEVRGTGVRVTLIEPAATDTPLWDAVDRVKNPGLPERAQMLAPEAVASSVMFALENPAAVAIKYVGLERW